MAVGMDPYTVFKAGDCPVAGLVAKPPEGQASCRPAAWTSYGSSVPNSMIARDGSAGMYHLPMAERNSDSKRAASVNLSETSGHALSMSPCLRR